MTTPLRRRLRLCRRGAWYALAALLVLFALGNGIGSQLLPLVERNPQQIADWLSQRAQRKVVQKVQDLTFNAKEAERRGQSITYVSEKAVFRLGAQGLVLTEIAPGLDVRKDVLDTLSCEVTVADNIAQMPACCFAEGTMGLRDQWLNTLNTPNATTDH